MPDPYFQTLFADRIGGAQYGKSTAIYKFEKIKRAKRQALAEHPERRLLDFGIGENDGVADEVIRRRMAEEIGKPENRGYADNGGPEMTVPVRASMVPNARWQFVLLYTAPAEAKARAVEDINAAVLDGAIGVGEGVGLPLHHFPLEQSAAAHEAVEQGAVWKVLIDVEG